MPGTVSSIRLGSEDRGRASPLGLGCHKFPSFFGNPSPGAKPILSTQCGLCGGLPGSAASPVWIGFGPPLQAGRETHRPQETPPQAPLLPPPSWDSWGRYKACLGVRGPADKPPSHESLLPQKAASPPNVVSTRLDHLCLVPCLQGLVPGSGPGF